MSNKITYNRKKGDAKFINIFFLHFIIDKIYISVHLSFATLSLLPLETTREYCLILNWILETIISQTAKLRTVTKLYSLVRLNTQYMS